MFNATLELSDLNGNNGFTIDGLSGGGSGYAVSDAGDVNGDGISDLIIGAYSSSPGGRSGAGTSYVVFGRDAGFSSSLELSTLDGTNGFAINGVAAGDNSGSSVSGAGDVNGDGISDVIIGAHFADPSGRSSAGTSYVVFGKDTGFSASLELSTLDGTNGFAINGVATSDESGISVSSAGDLNDDGIGDVIVGAWLADPVGRTQAGASYVIFGKDTAFSSPLELSTLDGANGFAINGAVLGDLSGFSVSNAGDLNSDGISDVIIGAYGADPNGINAAGISYVVFGKDTGFSASLELSSINGTNGLAMNGVAALDETGYSVSGAGDVNGDGISDVIIGADFAAPGGRANAGASYVIFGKDTGFSSPLELSTLDGTNGFAMNGVAANDVSGSSVSGAGDVNGDGISDVIIGAYAADPSNRTSAGASYLVFGKNTGFSASLELSTLNGTDGFVINGVASGDRSGYSVSNAVDINGDGANDVVIGAPSVNSGVGASYVIYGIPAPIVATTSTTGGSSTSSGETSPASQLEPSVVNFLFGSHANFFARGAEMLGSTFTAVKPVLGM